MGLPRMRWHHLRHGAASLLLDEGVPLSTLTELLGHIGIAITKDTHGHLSERLQRQAAQAMDAPWAVREDGWLYLWLFGERESTAHRKLDD